MGWIRPATPGFLCTLVATILLVVVSFCVPYFKSVFFLKASITENNVNGSITFGTLGYCIQLGSNTTCSKPSVGYELDINGLVGNRLPVEIPQVAVKWITYALVLHIVALVLSAGSAAFGLLAHVREMSMTCCSTFISGLAAAVTLLAFIFDIVLFFVARARIDAVGSASIGNAIWLTLAAWILLFFSGCFYTLGRCCISNRSRGPRNNWDNNKFVGDGGQPNYAEQMRLDAVKAEADRKAMQKTEVGLPIFAETQPLTARVDGDNVYTDSYHDHNSATSPATTRPPNQNQYGRGGYVQAPVGSRAVDEYYNPTRNNNSSTYPPQPTQPQRQQSTRTYAPSQYAPSVYAPSTHTPPVPTTTPPNNQYLSAGQYNNHEYGHTQGGTSYHSAQSHQQYPTNHSYGQQAQPQQNYSVPYTGAQPGGYAYQEASYYSPLPSPTPQAHRQEPEHSYTLGGDGYGGNSVPPLPDHPSQIGENPYGGYLSPAIIDTNVASSSSGKQSSPVKGPRTMSPQQYEDSPPGYELGATPVPPGGWDRKQ